MRSKKINIPGIGDILLECSPKAKYLNLSVRPFRGARVAVPRSATFASAAAFAKSKSEWLKSRLERMAAMEQHANTLRDVLSFDKSRARKQLILRTQTLAGLHDFTYNRLFIRNQKTRWGSCSQNNNISLNINLVFLPSELMDYTIVHELMHTRIKNHGPLFWSELANHIHSPKELDKKLNHYSALLASASIEQNGGGTKTESTP